MGVCGLRRVKLRITEIKIGWKITDVKSKQSALQNQALNQTQIKDLTGRG